MKYGSNRATLAQIPLLMAVTKVVVNRMRSADVHDIRYMSIPGFRGAESMDCDALRLFVPDIHFLPNPNRFWGTESGW